MSRSLAAPAAPTWLIGERLPGLLTGGLALAATCVVLYVTGAGIGTTPDAVVYVGAARQLLAGQGLTLATGSLTPVPLTHHAPLYPLLLATLGLAGLDPLAGARWLNAFLFGANVWLIATMLTLPGGRPGWASVVAAGLSLPAIPLLGIHAMAWSEPAYLLTSLAGLLTLAAYIRSERRGWLFAAAGLSGMALLTRYAGVALLLSGTLGILLFARTRLARRLADGLLYGALAVMPAGLWMVRNLWLAGTATNRSLSFHPLTRGSLHQALDTLSSWFWLPAGLPAGLRAAALLGLLAGAIALWVGLDRSQRLSRAAGSGSSDTAQPALARLLLLYGAVYVCFLMLSLSFLDANTPLDDRILAPLYPVVLVLALLLGQACWRTPDASARLRPALVGALLVCGATQLAVAARWTAENRQGIGFTHPVWRQSELLSQVRGLPAGIPLYTNLPEPIYLYTGRPALPLPRQVEAVTRRPNLAYPAQVGEARQLLETAGAAVVYFDVQTRATPDWTDLEAALGLRVLTRTSDGAIFVSDTNR